MDIMEDKFNHAINMQERQDRPISSEVEGTHEMLPLEPQKTKEEFDNFEKDISTNHLALDKFVSID